MRHLVFLLALVLCHASVAGEAEDTLTAELERLTEKGQIQQTVVAFVDSESIRYQSFGEPAPDRDSLFEIGSITKVFTALLAAEAVRLGKLSWDQSLDKLSSPDQEFASPRVAQITPRQIASHQSGLPRMPGNFSPADWENPYADYSEADLWDFLAGFELDESQNEYEYSNLGFGLLGEIAARAFDERYSAALRRYVLDPLEMQATYTLATAPKSELLAGHSGKLDAGYWAFDVMAPAGALIASTADLAKFVAINLQPEGHPLAESLLAIREVQGSAAGAGGNIAFAWHTINSSPDNKPAFFHNGGTGGFRSVIAFRPDQGRGVVLLTNSDSELTPLAIGYLLGKPQAPSSFPNELLLNAANLDAYIGTYALAPGAFLTVTRNESQLSVQLTGQASFPVFPFEPDAFFYKVVDARLRFVRDASGTVVSVTLLQNGQELPAPRLAPEDAPKSYTEIDVAIDVLQGLEGQYQFTFGAKLTVQEIAGQLYATLSGQPRFPVYAYAEDNFFYRVVDAQLTFNRDTDGEVVSVTLHQNDADQVAPRIDDQ
jgi:CubicO group peptidase (beta-lactamase class C family)